MGVANELVEKLMGDIKNKRMIDQLKIKAKILNRFEDS